MKGLLLKDFYMMRSYCKLYPVVILVFLVIGTLDQDNLFLVFYPCVFAAMLPVTLLGYDERSRWHEYSGTLPYTRAQIVSGKYWMGSILQLIIFGLVAITQAVQMHWTGRFTWNEYFTILSMLWLISCMTSSITLPVMFKLRVEKGRMVYSLMIGLVCGGSFMASTTITSYRVSTIMGVKVAFPGMLLILCGLSFAVYLFSWRLSIRFYEKREF